MNVLLKTNKGLEGRGGEGKKLDFVRGRGRDRKPNNVACSTRLVGGWVMVVCGAKSNKGLAGPNILYTWCENVSLGEGSDWVKETHFCKNGMKIYFSLVLYRFPFSVVINAERFYCVLVTFLSFKIH